MAKKQAAPKDELAERAREVDRLREFVDSTTFSGDLRDASGELSAVDQHPADVADITMQREVDYTIKRIVEDEAEQVREAMDRRAQGRYGICEECNQPIPKARLAARPQATLCVDCQRRRETGR
jgi:DnaK suppressor protein